MENNNFDHHLKRKVKADEVEVPDLVRNRINITLNELPERSEHRRAPSSMMKYVLSGAICLLITFLSISYILDRNFIFPGSSGGAPNQKEDVVIYDYTFSGKSEHWKGTYEFYGRGVFYQDGDATAYDSESEDTFTLEFEGNLDELRNTTVTYTYKVNTSESGGSVENPTSKVFQHHSSAKGGSMVEGDQIIEVTIEWAGQEEKLYLERVQP